LKAQKSYSSYKRYDLEVTFGADLLFDYGVKSSSSTSSPFRSSKLLSRNHYPATTSWAKPLQGQLTHVKGLKNKPDV
jgi:hypothetical protein